jgi:30S ribosome assembly GTPase
MQVGNSLWLGGLCRIDYLEGSEVDLIVYVSPDVSVHRTLIQKSNEFYVKHHGSLLKPTYSSDVAAVDFDRVDMALTNVQYGV